jgi:hypothetical protein
MVDPSPYRRAIGGRESTALLAATSTGACAAAQTVRHKNSDVSKRAFMSKVSTYFIIDSPAKEK